MYSADKECHPGFLNVPDPKNNPFRIDGLNEAEVVGIEHESYNAKSSMRRLELTVNAGKSSVLVTREACDYLRISRPTYVKYLAMGRVNGIKAGKDWKVLKSELDRFLTGEHPDESSWKATPERDPGNPIPQWSEYENTLEGIEW